MMRALRRLIVNRDRVETQHQSPATLKINGTRGWRHSFRRIRRWRRASPRSTPVDKLEGDSLWRV
jgi:hypothetical protein